MDRPALRCEHCNSRLPDRPRQIVRDDSDPEATVVVSYYLCRSCDREVPVERTIPKRDAIS
jgi:DNA-directed RNA polymerase subunit RPC12/RpoP